MLVSYFGETKSADCGVCDVCLRKKRKEINDRKSKEIVTAIREVVSEMPVNITVLITKLAKYKENDVLTILRWLIEEGDIQSDGDILTKL
jgi:ATP-dependent DNA helicase RecQ